MAPLHHCPRHSVLVLLAITALSAGLTRAAFGQEEAADKPQDPVNLPPDLVKSAAKDEVPLASDGKPAIAGRVPEGTPGDAAELWRQIVASLSVDGVDVSDAPRAFELEFDLRLRTKGGTQNTPARFTYLDIGPGLVRGVMLDTGGAEVSTQMRGLGPNNKLEYWFRKVKGDNATDGWLRLIGRTHRESQDQIDEWAAISFNLARLTRPGSLRIIGLRQRRVQADAASSPGVLRLEGDAGLVLPETDIEGVRGGGKQALSKLCAGLHWLEMSTPDFRLFREARSKRGSKAPRVFRLLFGIDPETWRPQIVVVAPGKNGPLQVAGTVLIQCTEWFEHGPEDDQSWLPGRFFAYESVPVDGDDPARLRFSDVPVADLYMHTAGTMRATLGRGDFLPEK